MIYFLQVAGHGPVKIGCTNGSVGWRLRNIQSGSPHELVILGIHEGGRNEEQSLHKRFKHLNVRSEWFRPAQELMEYIAEYSSIQKLREIERDDLKKIITRDNRREWTANERKVFSGRIDELGRDFSDWIGGFKPATNAVVHVVETFLAEKETGIHRGFPKQQIKGGRHERMATNRNGESWTLHNVGR